MNSESSMVLSVTSAPISVPCPGMERMVLSSSSPRMSSRYFGVNNRCFIDGSRSVPPAMIWMSGAYFERYPMASSIERGRRSLNDGRLTQKFQMFEWDHADDVAETYALSS